jgi:hypothetical protein
MITFSMTTILKFLSCYSNWCYVYCLVSLLNISLNGISIQMRIIIRHRLLLFRFSLFMPLNESWHPQDHLEWENGERPIKMKSLINKVVYLISTSISTLTLTSTSTSTSTFHFHFHSHSHSFLPDRNRGDIGFISA